MRSATCSASGARCCSSPRLLPRLMGIDLEREAKALEQQLGMKQDSGLQSAYAIHATRAFRLSSGRYPTAGALEAEAAAEGMRVFVLRVRRGDRHRGGDADDRTQAGRCRGARRATAIPARLRGADRGRGGRRAAARHPDRVGQHHRHQGRCRRQELRRAGAGRLWARRVRLPADARPAADPDHRRDADRPRRRAVGDRQPGADRRGDRAAGLSGTLDARHQHADAGARHRALDA